MRSSKRKRQEQELKKSAGKTCIKCNRKFVSSDVGNICFYIKGPGHFKCEKAKGK